MISQDCVSSLARQDGGSCCARDIIRTVSGRLDAPKQFHCSAHVGPVIRFCHSKRPAVFEGATFAQQHGQTAIQCVQALGGITHEGELTPEPHTRLFNSALRVLVLKFVDSSRLKEHADFVIRIYETELLRLEIGVRPAVKGAG